MQKLKTENIVLNKEIATIFLKEVDEILNGMELMMNPKMLKTLDKRLKHVKSGKNIKSMAELEKLMREQGIAKR